MNATASRGELHQLVKKVCEDRRNRALPGILLTHVILIGAFAALYFWPSWLTAVAVFITVGLMQYRLAMSCHEAVHKTLLFPVRLNEFVSIFHGALVGIHMARYRVQHLAHHRAHDDAEDPDAYIYRPILATRRGWRRVAVWILGTPGEVVQKFLMKSASLGNKDAGGNDRFQSLVMVGVNVALLGLFAYVFKWWYYFVFWLLPVMTVAVFMNRTRILVEHGFTHVWAGRDCNNPMLVETVDVLTNPLEVFFFTPFHFNFHYAHHRFPSVPHYRNREVSDRLAEVEASKFRCKNSYLVLLGRILLGRTSETVPATSGTSPNPARLSAPTPLLERAETTNLSDH